MGNQATYRRRLLVSARRQLPHLFGMSLLAIVNTALLLALLVWVFVVGVDDHLSLTLHTSLVFKVIVLLLATTAVTAVWSLRATRSTAGLLHKVTGILRQAVRGEVVDKRTLGFRRADAEFKELEALLCAVVDRLEQVGDVPPEAVARLGELERNLKEGNLSMQEAAGEARLIRKLFYTGGKA